MMTNKNILTSNAHRWSLTDLWDCDSHHSTVMGSQYGGLFGILTVRTYPALCVTVSKKCQYAGRRHCCGIVLDERGIQRVSIPGQATRHLK